MLKLDVAYFPPYIETDSSLRDTFPLVGLDPQSCGGGALTLAPHNTPVMTLILPKLSEAQKSASELASDMEEMSVRTSLGRP
jgi:hypothetical protein